MVLGIDRLILCPRPTIDTTANNSDDRVVTIFDRRSKKN